MNRGTKNKRTHHFTNLQAKGFSSFTVDNLNYRVTGSTAVELTGYVTRPTGILDIPATVSYEGSEYSVTEIGDEAFAYCENLTELVVPPTVTIIGQHAFHYNRQFTKIVVHATTPPLMRQDAFANTEPSTPVYVPAESLEAYKAANRWKDFTNLQAIVVDNFTVDGLKYRIIDEENNRVEVTGYEGYVRENIPATVSYGGKDYSVTRIGNKAFAECFWVSSFTLPDGLTSIGEEAFSYCWELVEFTIPNSVETIEKAAFAYNFMQKITIGSGVKSIADEAFADNDGFAEMTVLAVVPPTVGTDAFRGTKRDIPVYVPSSALAAYKATPYWEEFTNIQAYDPNRFNVDGLRYEITDESAKEVELVGAIVTLTGKLDIPTTVTHNDISYTVTSVGDEAFAFDSDLTELVFPHTVEYIGDHAFHYCTELTKITTYATVPPYVGTQAFAGADKEIPVIVPFNSINAYKAANGWSEFTNIRSTFVIDNLRLQLTDATAKEVSVVGYVMLPPTGKLEIPETVDYYGESYTITYIGDDSFADCTKLTELILPKTVTGVGARAFFDNAAFKRMTIHAVVPPFMGDEAFAAADFSTPLYVPEEGYDDYLNADGWKYFDVQVIQSSVSELTMPESIRVYGGTLHNPEGLAVTVYDLTGRIAYEGRATSVSLAAGVYVVRCNGATGKAVF